MLTRSRIIARASGYAGEPADEPLPTGIPHWMRYEIVAELETELLRDEVLSSQNRMMAKVPIRLTAGKREFILNQSGMEDPAYISLTVEGDTNTVPIPIEIGNVTMLDQDARDGRRTIGFYADRPQTGVLSWMPTAGEILTIWYDRSPATDPNPEQATLTITESYAPLLSLLLAAQMLELLKQPIGEMLKGRIARGLKQWERFARNGKQQGVVKKGTYRPERFRLGNIWDAWPGRVPLE